jgi:hypothetical protein
MRIRNPVFICVNCASSVRRDDGDADPGEEGADCAHRLLHRTHRLRHRRLDGRSRDSQEGDGPLHSSATKA